MIYEITNERGIPWLLNYFNILYVKPSTQGGYVIHFVNGQMLSITISEYNVIIRKIKA